MDQSLAVNPSTDARVVFGTLGTSEAYVGARWDLSQVVVARQSCRRCNAGAMPPARAIVEARTAEAEGLSERRRSGGTEAEVGSVGGLVQWVLPCRNLVCS